MNPFQFKVVIGGSAEQDLRLHHDFTTTTPLFCMTKVGILSAKDALILVIDVIIAERQ